MSIFHELKIMPFPDAIHPSNLAYMPSVILFLIIIFVLSRHLELNVKTGGIDDDGKISYNQRILDMSDNKIVPSIWLSADGGQLSNIIEYYKTVFGKDFQAGQIMPLGQTPSSNTEICEVAIFGQQYTLMSTEKEHHALNDSVSFMINCDDQKEIDHFWDYFTQEGKESQCGWCLDKYGLRWQVIPKNLGELMRKPNSFEIMMKQKKIVIDEYLK